MMMQLERLSDEVFVAKEETVIIGDVELAFIKKQALLSPRKRARICAHQSSGDLLHEMFIALSKKTYIQPHRHLNKSESFHVIEGEVDVILFEDDGSIHQIISLGSYYSGCPCFYRLNSFRYHTLFLRSDILVLHEVTNGPFYSCSTEYAPFSPNERDLVSISDYGVRLMKQIDIYWASEKLRETS